MNTPKFETNHNTPNKELPEPSPKTYLYTFLVLILLLAASFLLARVDLGPLNTSVGLLIAALKAVLVGLYF
ncbi:MAG: hypothetical protein ABIQ95_01010, partial [Bdellovibrionia bacterium]